MLDCSFKGNFYLTYFVAKLNKEISKIGHNIDPNVVANDEDFKHHMLKPHKRLMFSTMMKQSNMKLD